MSLKKRKGRCWGGGSEFEFGGGLPAPNAELVQDKDLQSNFFDPGGRWFVSLRPVEAKRDEPSTV